MLLKKNSRGFSLIEVLVTIVLSVVAILGVLALQSKSIQYTQDAVNRNTAIALTNEFVEIMRANRNELFNKKPPQELMYSHIKSTSDFYRSGESLAFPAFTADDCKKPAQTIKEQAGCWLKKVEASLPGAQENDVRKKFKVCPSFEVGSCAEASQDYKGSNVEVQVAWRVRKGECFDGKPDSTVCTYTTRVEL